MDELGPRIFEAYGLKPLRILLPQKGYRNTSLAAELPDGRWVNAIIYKSEPGILDTVHLTNKVGNYLYKEGLPARRQIDDRIIRLANKERGIMRYAGLYDYLPGDTIPWEAYTMDHIKQLGGMLSTMHSSLRGLHADHIGNIYEIYWVHFRHMVQYFEDDGVMKAMNRKLSLKPPLASCREALVFLPLCAKLPDQQVLHMDFVRGNVLFEGTRITGILDFEKTAYGHPLFDIARTLAFLLVDCKYKPPDKIRKYFLTSGYAKRGPSPLRMVNIRTESGKADLLERLLNMFLLYDFYKFLRHNPYESLKENEHYTRTVALMKERGLIQSVNQMVK